MPRQIRTVSVLTHNYPEQTAPGLERVIESARGRGVTLLFDREELGKHGISVGDLVQEEAANQPDLCLTLGGDGTVLRALRKFIGTEVPIFSVNFGRIGFLTAVEKEAIDSGLDSALSGSFETVGLPALKVQSPDFADNFAVNDVAVHRKPELRVAQLSYSLQSELIGSVSCDGLVVATPAGSTGYNLANGGPILAWGVEGYVISFVSPHTLTARPLLAAAEDVLTVGNESQYDEVEITVDGRKIGRLAPSSVATITFAENAAQLAQLPGSNFYRRFREKFGRL